MGGLLNGSVLNDDLIDEISLILTPLILNNTRAPSLFQREIKDTLNIKKYKLTEVTKMDGDSVYLRYQRS